MKRPNPFANLTPSPTWTAALPMDPVRENAIRPVRETASFVDPTPVSEPFLLNVSALGARDLGIDADGIRAADFASLLTGNETLEGMAPFATNYGGHQFGNWADQLGDGRAISVAEFLDGTARRSEWQLKGAGPTPYSRFADGRAVLRSSVREYVASEAMAQLGVPTTRALWLAGTGEDVIRDRFYDGHPEAEPGAVVCRVAPSWIRFGHFELPAARGEVGMLRELVTFCMRRDFPDIDGVAAWFREICGRTAVMIAHWQRVGFVHGVMNTDNMSILGLTLDYGPYGFLDAYDPDWTPNTTDAATRRYRFARQPAVGFWNLQRLAMAISPLFADTEPLREGLIHYERTFVAADERMQLAKLGFAGRSDTNLALVQDLRTLMAEQQLDFTGTYHALADLDGLDLLAQSYRDDGDSASIDAWVRRYRAASDDGTARRGRMRENNPIWVPHNWMLQELIDQCQVSEGQRRECEALTVALAASADPDAYPEQVARWSGLRPGWAMNERGCTDLSCSS